ncbi:YraN family protein [Chitinophaga sp. Mgbs1]|uniref:UPF0102 protein ECE50_006465 n=1 Tax=Chitinophaga solisilvae TaxID=1233460 RepID=A0A433WPE1_9BACT|nr:YraN family protein [Chitinophaga solisilvae]
MKDRQLLGQQGEAIAREYTGRYCRLLHTNWKYGRKEIDIIAVRNNIIYFIEVKTRTGNRFGWPEEAVDDRKQEHIREVAAAYLEIFDLHPAAIRFDIIAITFTAASWELLHLRDVF